MSNQWFECVCQFFRSQTESLGEILQTLGHQNTISDIGTSDDLQVPQASMPTASPMSIFLIILAMVWAFMFLFSRHQKAKNEKPTRLPDVNPEDDDDKRPGQDDGGIM